MDGRQQDAYYFCVGGAVGLHQSVARPIGYRCLASEVPDAIERLLLRYLDERSPVKICGTTLRAAATTSCASAWQGSFCRQSSATLRRERCRMRWKARGKRELENNRNVILSAASPFACEWTGGVEGSLAVRDRLVREGIVA